MPNKVHAINSVKGQKTLTWSSFSLSGRKGENKGWIYILHCVMSSGHVYMAWVSLVPEPKP